MITVLASNRQLGYRESRGGTGSAHLLRGAAKGAHGKPAKLRMLCFARGYTLAPHSKRRGFHLEPHELYDL